MAGFTGYPFSYNTSPSSSSSTSSSASSAGGGGGIPSFAAASSVPSFGAPSPPLFGSSYSSPFEPSSNGFSFRSPYNSSMPFNNSSTPNTTPTNNNDEATIRKIIESIEMLEKLAKNGAFPQDKLDEIKKEVEKKYPNIFSTKNPGQNNTTNNININNNTYNTNNNNTSSTLLNDPLGWENYYTNQQEYWRNYQLEIQQQVNQEIEYWKNYHLNIIQQNQMTEHYMRMYSTNNNSGVFSPNYFGNGVHYPSYNYNYNNNNSSAEGWKMAFEMIGNTTSNDGLFNNILGNITGFGTVGFSALSFLGSLLGGGFGF